MNTAPNSATRRGRPRHVTVIGGGVIGLTTALYLHRSGAEVELFERSHVGSGASAANAGWIVPALAAPVPAPGVVAYGLRSLRDREGPFAIRPQPTPSMLSWLWRFRAACDGSAHHRGLVATARLAEGTSELYADLVQSGVPVSVHSDGMLMVFDTARQAAQSLAALAPLADHGVAVPTQIHEGDDLRRLEPALGPAARAGYLVPDQQHVNPAALVRALAEHVRSLGVLVHEGVDIRRLVARDRRVEAVLDSAGNTVVKTDAVVVSAGVHSVALARQLGVRLPMQPGKGYSFSMRATPLPRQPIYLPGAKVALTPLDGRLRLAGVMELGASSLTVNRRRMEGMRRATDRYLATELSGDTCDLWAGLRPVPSDGLPICGALPGFTNAYVATGHAMLGVTLAPATGKALAELILTGHCPERLEPFSPARFATVQTPMRAR